MVTTSSTSSTSATTASSSSISYQLGAGSGIDVLSLVTNLSNAAKAPKENLLAKREEAVSTRLSALNDIKTGIDSFSSALSSLVNSGTLFSQPSVSDSTILGATATAGARLTNFSAQFQVQNLAKAQVMESVSIGRTDPVGEGTLTLTSASGAFDIVIDSSNNSLDGLASAINAAGAGVTASVITDPNGARLVMKGATGSANAFSLAVAAGGGSGIERFAYGPGVTGGMTGRQNAENAVILMDNVSVERATNSFSDLFDGITIDLKKAAPGTTVSIGVTRPTEAITQAVNDFAAAFNELLTKIDSLSANGIVGSLRGDVAVSSLRNQLARIATTQLASQGTGPRTLAEIGVKTGRDGKLSVDAVRLAQKLKDDPAGVEALFNPSQYSSSPLVTIKSSPTRVKPGTYEITDIVPGNPASGKIDGLAMGQAGSNLIAPSTSKAAGLIVNVSTGATAATITIDPGLLGALNAVKDSLGGSKGAFASSKERLDRESKAIATERDTLTRQSEKYYNQLLSTFTAMDKQVSAFRATQSYLTQQINIWTKSSG